MAGTSSPIKKKALREETRRTERLYQARDIESKEPKSDNLHEVRSTQQCHFCGGPYSHNKGPCPGKGKEGRKCGKRNHFAKVCPGK